MASWKARVPLAISYFLRQHDLVQVPWVFLSLSQPTGTPARRGDTISGFGSAQGPAGDLNLPLVFDGPLLIVGGGFVEPQLLFELGSRARGIVGADSGGDAILAAGLVPDAVIGDMDSVADPDRFPPKTRMLALAEQETTDFEKCLYCTRAPVTLAVGMTGGRFDHTLAALHAVTRHAMDRTIVLVDGHDVAVGVAGPLRLGIGKGERVSIYPLGRTAFASSSGLAYPLDGLEMEQGTTIGTSNRAVADEIGITVAPGAQDPWLLIVGREHLGLFL